MSAKEPPYNAPLAISKSGRILHVTIGGGLELFSTRDSLHTVVEQIVNSYNACAGMSDPAKEIQSMREALKVIAAAECFDLGEYPYLPCLDVPDLKLEDYCPRCLARHTLKNL